MGPNPITLALILLFGRRSPKLTFRSIVGFFMNVAFINLTGFSGLPPSVGSMTTLKVPENDKLQISIENTCPKKPISTTKYPSDNQTNSTSNCTYRNVRQ